MDFALRIGGDDRVHEMDESDAPASLVIAADDFAAGKVDRGEQRRRPGAFVVVGLSALPLAVLDSLARVRAPEWTAFRPGEHDGVVGRCHIASLD